MFPAILRCSGNSLLLKFRYNESYNRRFSEEIKSPNKIFNLPEFLHIYYNFMLISIDLAAL